MARVYRHCYSGGRKSKRFYLEYRDASGRIRRKAASTDRKVSQIMLADILKREDRIRGGIVGRHEESGGIALADLEEDFVDSRDAVPSLVGSQDRAAGADGGGNGGAADGIGFPYSPFNTCTL